MRDQQQLVDTTGLVTHRHTGTGSPSGRQQPARSVVMKKSGRRPARTMIIAQSLLRMRDEVADAERSPARSSRSKSDP